MERRLAQIEESVARYLRQLDSADRQEPSEARTTKTTRLRRIAKLKTVFKRLRIRIKTLMLATAIADFQHRILLAQLPTSAAGAQA